MFWTTLILSLICAKEVFALTCLKCDGISQPRHCRQVVDCGPNSQCSTEKVLNSFGEVVYNLGCLQTVECSRQSHSSSVSCAECCTSNLCNVQGCGQPDYPLYRGPICYACSAYTDPSRCHNIDFCAIGEVCSLSGKYEFSEMVFSSACTSKSSCGDIMVDPSTSVGRRNSESLIKRSHEQHTCDSCCAGDLCNKNCSSVTMIQPITSPRPSSITETGMQDCKAILDAGLSTGDGLYATMVNGNRVEVFCDMTTDGGGWTVFQYRYDGSVDFYRNFTDYEEGFGKYPGEFWQGLKWLYNMTSSKSYQLRVDLTAPNGTKGYAKYSTFTISAPHRYVINTGGYSGNAGDKMKRQEGEAWSTQDRDQSSSGGNCARSFQGAWWYASCYDSNLNGPYKPGAKGLGQSMVWANWPDPSAFYTGLKGSKMSIKPL